MQAPPQAVPGAQSLSLQHWPGGGLVSQLPATHTASVSGVETQSAFEPQH